MTPIEEVAQCIAAWDAEGLGECPELHETNYPGAWEDVRALVKRLTESPGRENFAPRAWCASEHLRPGAAPRYNDSWVRCSQDACHEDEHSDDVSGLTWTD